MVTLLRGENEWKFWHPGSVVDYDKDLKMGVCRQATPDVTILQKAGDTLYLAAGWWHEVITTSRRGNMFRIFLACPGYGLREEHHGGKSKMQHVCSPRRHARTRRSFPRSREVHEGVGATKKWKHKGDDDDDKGKGGPPIMH